MNLEFAFFNGSNERIIVDKVTGFINCTDPLQSAQLPSPNLDVNQTTTVSEPLEQFLVKLEQRVPKEMAQLIAQRLDVGMPLSLNLTGLGVWLRPAMGSNLFEARTWHGITCTKKRDAIICNRLVFLSMSSQTEALGTTSRPS
jgi:hypothetical protein